MKIEKVLNNNVVVINDEHGNERVVMGRGLAFKKRAGEHIDPEKIDKEFFMANPDINSMFQELIAEIPIEYLEMGKEIITYAKTHLGKQLKESIYLAIVDHMYTAISRFKDGIVVKNALLWDIKRFYPDEYFIGTVALDKIEEKFGVRLPDDEADDDLFEIIKLKYSNAYKCILKVSEFILNKYDYNLSNEEKLYLTIHVERIIYKSDNNA